MALPSSLESCLGALDSREFTSCDTWSFWDGLAYWPRSVDAAMRRIEFRVAMLSTNGNDGVAVAVTAGSVTTTLSAVTTSSTVDEGAEPFASCASSNDLWNVSVA